MITRQVLFAGGSGVVGRAALRWFRQRHPNFPVLVGGRNLERARTVAGELGHAQPVLIDLDQRGLGLDKDAALAAVVMLAPDNALHGLRLAQERGIPYLTISNGLTEIGPEVTLFAHGATAAPIVLASHWMAGAAMFLALDSAMEFERVGSIRLGAILDELDAAGPSSLEDMKRVHSAAPAAFVFEEGRRRWVRGDLAGGKLQAVDGRVVHATAFSTLDTVSLYAATAAPEIRFDLATAASSSRRRGSGPAAEIVVEIEGEIAGRTRHIRSSMEFMHGAASLTGISVVLSLATALGLEGRPHVAAGLYLPELLSDAKWFLDQLQRVGATLKNGYSERINRRGIHSKAPSHFADRHKEQHK